MYNSYRRNSSTNLTKHFVIFISSIQVGNIKSAVFRIHHCDAKHNDYLFLYNAKLHVASLLLIIKHSV